MKICCFKIGNEIFGIDILLVKEIASISEIVKVPGTYKYHFGLMNLRGNVVSLIHPELFADSFAPFDANTQKIVIFKNNEGMRHLPVANFYRELDLGNDMIGLIIDKVSDVIEVEKNDLRELPQNISDKLNCILEGVVSMGDHLVLVISLELMLKEINKSVAHE